MARECNSVACSLMQSQTVRAKRLQYLPKVMTSDKVQQMRIDKPVSCRTFHRSFAAHLLEDGYDIHTVQKLLGHKSVRMAMIYTHVLNHDPLTVRNPLGRVEKSKQPTTHQDRFQVRGSAVDRSPCFLPPRTVNRGRDTVS